MADEIVLFKYEILNDVTHCFTARTGGVSSGGQKSLNLSFSREKSEENVRENYRRVAKKFGTEFQNLTRVSQKHTKNVLKITKDLVGIGISKELPDYVKNTGFDAMITDVPEAVLCTSHADCVPVMLYDSENNAVAAIHSGWRGTVQKISAETVARMSSEYSTDPEFLKAVIGPSIGIDRFETDSDVFEALKNAFTEKFDEYSTKYIYQKNNEEGKLKYYISVSGFVYETLLEAGLKPENIYYDNRCTFENEDLFFSHRRDKGDTGIMAAMISPRR